MMKIKPILLAAIAALGLAAHANAQVEVGKDYTVLPKPLPQLQKDKIEVTEFFGYFCVHCYYLEPVLMKYVKAFPKDTYLRGIHVVWQPEMLPLARIAAAVNQSGLKLKADADIFNAYYAQKINLADPKIFHEWAAKQTDFDGKKLIAAYDSFGNPAEAQKMQALTSEYQISGTPTLIVGGKYQVKNQEDWNKTMKVVMELVSKVRAERGMKPVPAPVAVKSQGASLARAANQ